MVSALVSGTDRVVLVRTLAGDICVEFLTLAVSFSIQCVNGYRRISNARGNPAIDLSPIQKGVEILLVTSHFTKPGRKLQPDGPLGSYKD